MKIFRHFFYY